MEIEKHVLSFDGKDHANKIYQAVNMITLAAMAGISEETQNQVESLAVGVSAVAGALEGVAAIIGQRAGIDNESSPEEQRSTVNVVSTLVAALLVAKAHRREEIDGEKGELFTELNPIIYLAAIKAAETILGRNIDEELNPRMVGAARDWERKRGVFGGWEQQTHEIQVGHSGPLH